MLLRKKRRKIFKVPGVLSAMALIIFVYTDYYRVGRYRQVALNFQYDKFDTRYLGSKKVFNDLKRSAKTKYFLDGGWSDKAKLSLLNNEVQKMVMDKNTAMIIAVKLENGMSFGNFVALLDIASKQMSWYFYTKDYVYFIKRPQITEEKSNLVYL